MSAARRIEETAVAKQTASSGTRFKSGTGARPFAIVTWPDIVRAVERETTRETLMARYRAAGFTPDDFAGRRGAREAMADALTRTEDALEDRSSVGSRERAALCDVRRRLEWELWP